MTNYWVLNQILWQKSTLSWQKLNFFIKKFCTISYVRTLLWNVRTSFLSDGITAVIDLWHINLSQIRNRCKISPYTILENRISPYAIKIINLGLMICFPFCRWSLHLILLTQRTELWHISLHCHVTFPASSTCHHSWQVNSFFFFPGLTSPST